MANEPATTATTTLNKFTSLKMNVTLKPDGDNFVSWSATLEALLRCVHDQAWPLISTGSHTGTMTVGDMLDIKQIGSFLMTTSVDQVITQRLYQGKTEAEKAELKDNKLWKAIKEYCVENTGASQVCAYSQFTNFKFDDSKPVEENLSKFETIVDTIKLTGTEIPDKLVQAQLLRSLKTEQWRSFKESISGNPPDKYSSLKNRIVGAIIQRNTEDPNLNEVSALLSSTHIGNKNRPEFRFGYIPNQPRRGHGRGRGRGRGRGGRRQPPRNQHYMRSTYKEERSCYYCGKQGHIAQDCFCKNNRPRKELHAIEAPEVQMTEGEHSVGSHSDFVVDSGATHHCVNNINHLSNYEPFPSSVEVKLGGPQPAFALGQGSVDLHFKRAGTSKVCRLRNVLYVPGLRRNLFSIAKAADAGWRVEGDKKGLKLILKETEITAVREGNLYYLRLKEINENCRETMAMVPTPVLNVTEIGTLQKMHEALGHINKGKVKELLQREGIAFKDDNETCIQCIRGKQHRATYRTKPPTKSASQGDIDRSQIGRLIHTDLCMSPIPSLHQGSRYFMAITEDYTRFRKIYFLKNKEQAKQFIKNYLTWFNVQTGNKVKALLCDNGLEFVNSELRKVLDEQGCEFRTSAPYTPQQNGLSEKTNRTIVELTRTLMSSKEIPTSLWSETANCVVTLMNIVYTSQNTGITPYEAFYEQKPHLARIQPYGSKCFLLNHDPQRKKWDMKGIEAKLIGYEERMEAYRVWVPTLRKVVSSKDVVFPKESPLKKNADEVPSTNPRSRETMAEAALIEPQTVEEALSCTDRENWKSAMLDEIEAMKKNQVWIMSELPEGRQSIPNKWIFKYKTNAKGEIERHRARLVIKGYRQQKGIDFNETFSPVARFDTIRFLLAFSAERKHKLKQFDVKTAFLLAKLDEEIYMDQPEGFTDGTSRKCKLLQSLYGLKQAPRAFKGKFDEEMLKLGFIKSNADNCLFIKNQNGKLVLLCHYVDDGIVSAPENEDIEEIFTRLDGIFELSIKPLSYFLGIHVSVDQNYNIHLSQTKYITETIKKFGQEESKIVSTPTDSTIWSREEEQEKDGQRFPFQELIGSLNYIAIATRPDISFAISVLARNYDNSSRSDYIRATRVLKYLKGTKELGISFRGGNGNARLEGFSDSDYATDPTTRRSISAQVFVYNNGPIVWSSNQQKVVTLSSTEAEFLAAGEATKTALWLRQLFKDIGVEFVPTVQIDNISAIRLIKNPEFFKRVKHVDVKFKFICEKYERGEVSFEHVKTEDNLADICTKNLPKGVFLKLRALLGLK